MPVAYFDSSALVKLLIAESGSEVAAALWNACDAAVSSRLAYPEVRSALAAAERGGDLDAASGSACERRWQELWDAVRPVDLSPRLEQNAGEMAKRHGLRGADAVHLASASEIDSDLLVVAVWDRRLHAGVVAEGLAAVPRVL